MIMLNLMVCSYIILSYMRAGRHSKLVGFLVKMEWHIGNIGMHGNALKTYWKVFTENLWESREN